MPNRMLRDWTQSDKIDNVGVEAERFFTRLIMKADDYGCFWGDIRLLKANLFPLKLDKIREADISRWITECVKAGLILFYEVNQKKYVQIIDFKQRLDKARAKFPLPPHVNEFPEVDNEFPAEVEGNTNTKRGENRAPEEILEDRKKDFYKTLVPYLPTYGKEMLRDFYEYWTEPNKSNSKFRQEMQDTWDLARRLKTWASKDKNFNGVKNEQPAGLSVREQKDKELLEAAGL